MNDSFILVSRLAANRNVSSWDIRPAKAEANDLFSHGYDWQLQHHEHSQAHSSAAYDRG
jgi:hypothetical protein